MKKTYNILGICIMFFAMLIGTLNFMSCKKYDDGSDYGGNTNYCSNGYIPCGNTGKCCQPQYPYHGSNGYCYELLSTCQKNASTCTWCEGGYSGGGNGGGGNGSGNGCPAGYCHVTNGFNKCCPWSMPHYSNGKCYATKEDARKDCFSCVIYGCN